MENLDVELIVAAIGLAGVFLTGICRVYHKLEDFRREVRDHIIKGDGQFEEVKSDLTDVKRQLEMTCMTMTTHGERIASVETRVDTVFADRH